MTKLVTAIIPAYNAEDTLDETLNSVRAQTWTNLEILVFGDDSRDKPPIKTTWRSFWGRFRLWRMRNKPVTTRKYLELSA